MDDKKNVITVEVTCEFCEFQRDSYCYGRLCRGKPAYVKPNDYCSYGKEKEDNNS